MNGGCGSWWPRRFRGRAAADRQQRLQRDQVGVRDAQGLQPGDQRVVVFDAADRPDTHAIHRRRGGLVGEYEGLVDAAGQQLPYIDRVILEVVDSKLIPVKTGAGETDLMTLDDDASALALNRRTEFVFYGVLV